MIQLFKNSLKYKDSDGNMQDSGVLFASEKEKEWELIETITVEEDGVKILERTQEPDGTPYNFKKVMVYVYHPITTNQGQAGVQINDNKGYVLSSGLQLRTDDSTETLYYIEAVKDIIFGQGVIALGKVVEYSYA